VSTQTRPPYLFNPDVVEAHRFAAGEAHPQKKRAGHACDLRPTSSQPRV
jgi:hypothetical protein